jgi:hypothetical protein
MTDIEMTNPVPIDDITAYINSGTKELDPIPQTGCSTMLAIDCRHKRMIINDNVILAQLRGHQLPPTRQALQMLPQPLHVSCPMHG